MVEIFAIDLAYDVSQKLLSFHLILIALFLLAPELPRLADFFLNREVGPSRQPELFRSARANRVMVAFQIVAGIYLLGSYAYGNVAGWYSYGGGRQKSPFYGIWNVDELSIDGKLRPPLLTDHDRWRRVIFNFPDSVSFQGMDDSFAGYSASINSQGKTITLTKESDKNWRANFACDQTAPGDLTLDGSMDAHTIHMKLDRIETNKFPLANRKFHWIADYPFDRQEVRR